MVCIEQGPYLTRRLEVAHSLIIHGTKPGKEEVDSFVIHLMLSHDIRCNSLGNGKHIESRTLGSIPYVLTPANKECLHPTLLVGIAIRAKDGNLP